LAELHDIHDVVIAGGGADRIASGQPLPETAVV